MLNSDSKTQKEYQSIFAVLLFSLIIKIIYLFIYKQMPEWSMLTVDNYYHHNWAVAIVDGNIFGDTTYFRAPFYIYCLALLYKLFSVSLWTARIFGMLIGLASVFVTYLLAKRIFNHRIGITASLIQSITPIVIYFEQELLLDPLFMLLCQLTVLVFFKWIENKKNTTLFLSGLLLGLASITRPTSLVFMPVLLIIVFLTMKERRNIISYIILFTAACSIPMDLTFTRNLLVADDPVLIASQGGINFYIGNNEEADGITAKLPEPLGYNWQMREIQFIAEKELTTKLKPSQISSYWYNRAFEWIANNPVDFVKLYLKKFYYNFANDKVSNNRSLDLFFSKHFLLNIIPLNFGLIFLLAIPGLIFSIQNRFVKYLSVIMIIYLLLASLFFFSSRFRLPILPFYIIFASYGLMHFIETYKDKKKVIMFLSIAALCGFASYYPVIPKEKTLPVISFNSQGLHYYKTDHLDQSIFVFHQARLFDSTFPEINLNLGAAFLKTGKNDSAYYYFELEKTFNPNRYKTYVNLASLYHLIDSNLRAWQEINHALSICPFDLNANLMLIRITVSLYPDNFQSIDSILNECLNRTDSNIYLLYEGALYASQFNEYDYAVKYLNDALVRPLPSLETNDALFDRNFIYDHDHINELYGKINYQLGYIYGVTSQFDKSIRYSKIAIAKNPNIPEAYINLISAYISLQDFTSADSILNIANDKFPDNEYLRKFK